MGGRATYAAKISAKAEGFDVSGRMILLTMPRLFGFAFNPLSVYFCHDASGAPSAIAWEVTNTFGARHTYVLPVGARGGWRRPPKLRRSGCMSRRFSTWGLPTSFAIEASGDSA